MSAYHNIHNPMSVTNRTPCLVQDMTAYTTRCRQHMMLCLVKRHLIVVSAIVFGMPIPRFPNTVDAYAMHVRRTPEVFSQLPSKPPSCPFAANSAFRPLLNPNRANCARSPFSSTLQCKTIYKYGLTYRELGARLYW